MRNGWKGDKPMTKCDFCVCSILKNGVLICPQSYCSMSKADLIYLAKILGGKELNK